MTRYLSLWLPSLATDRIIRQAKHKARLRECPIATVAKIKNAQRLVAINGVAATHALKSGMALADARAIIPALRCFPADETAEAATLAAITDWCRRFTPLAALDPPDGVMLDVTGAAHLFGGEATLLNEIEIRLAAQGFSAAAALASTPEAAWALARFGRERLLPDCSEHEMGRHLGALPLAAVRLDEKILAELAQAGLRRIDDVLLRPRAPLAARFGSALFTRLDAMLGRAKTPITPRFEAPASLVERRFAEPISQRETVEATILALAHELAQLLTRHDEGARALDVSLFGVDGSVKHLRAGTSRPLRDPQTILRLFREKIEAAIAHGDEDDPLDAGFGFDLVRLSAETVERQDEDQVNWLTPVETEDLADLIDRLGARLGLRRVTKLALMDRHWPEFAVASVPAASWESHIPKRSPHPEERAQRASRRMGAVSALCPTPSPFEARSGASLAMPQNSHLRVRAQTYPAPHPNPLPTQLGPARVGYSKKKQVGQARLACGERKGLPLRPIRLLQKPEPIETIASVPDGPPVQFRWRRVLHEVAAIEGPERIAAEWWKDHNVLTRDYFRAEDSEGRRFWLFREGLYESETMLPRWFMHGLFA